jgi:ParB-like chromosome segregation protein Spo0J
MGVAGTSSAPKSRLELADVPRMEWVPIADVRPNPKNARTHSKKQIRQIATSIRKFGFLNPLIVDDENMILAGHGRLEGARLEGMAHVPIVRFGHLSEAQKRAYVIADNKIAEQAGWDRELLSIELAELIELLPIEELDVSITGFETAEIDLLLADMGPSRPEPEDAIPAVPEIAVTRRGDLWFLGKHRLLCGDSRRPADFELAMSGARAATVFTDPPYNLRMRAIGGRGRIQHPEFGFASGEMSQPEFRTFLSQTLGNASRVSAQGAVHFVCIDWRHISDLIEVGRELYGDMLNLVVWNKTSPGQGSFYRSQHELIGIFRVGEEPHRNNVELGRFGRNRSNVWTYAGVNTFGKGRMEALAAHPTVKPVALVADALLDCSARGDVVLDQFVGSGTTILAAEKVARIAIGNRPIDRRATARRTITGRLVSTSKRPKAIRPPPMGRTAMDDRKDLEVADYVVGYGRPPKATQFVAGKSGNSKGRPKGSRTVGAILQHILGQKIAVTENGKTRRIPILEVMFRRLVNDAVRRDAAALKLLLPLIDRYAASPETELHLGELLAEDQVILSQYLSSPAGTASDCAKDSKIEGLGDGV